MSVLVVGAGLAGCECAWQLASRGIDVTLAEMKPRKRSPAHSSDAFAELVCSNSLRGDRLENAAGLLKAEMRRMGSLILREADAARVPSGGALAVDREIFSQAVTQAVKTHPLITAESREITAIPETGGIAVVSTGPLTSDALAVDIEKTVGAGFLSFFDAAAPIITASSVDMSRAFAADRYGRGQGDYVNCPLERDEYREFRQALASAAQAPVRGFEDARVFEGCMPVEVLARRGEDTLRFGPLRPVGLRDPKTGRGAYAVAQLRREDKDGSMYNLVGFQTHLTFAEQRRVFTMIPALKNAEILRYGVMHRNTFLDSPRLLDAGYMLRSRPGLYFAGEITGVEGYVESAASGLTAGLAVAWRLSGREPPRLPPVTALGALSRHISGGTAYTATQGFQPMNINFGLLPPLERAPRNKAERYAMLSARALDALEEWISEKGVAL